MKPEQLKKNISFEEKIIRHIFPSKQEFELLYFSNLNRQEICDYFDISVSTFKKIRRYYQLPPKKRVVDKNTYPQRVETILNTLTKKYGEKNSESRRKFYQTVHQKIEQTYEEKHGITLKEAQPIIVQKRKDTLLNKYGVDNPMKCTEYQEKAQNTDIKKYGCRYHINSPEVREKARQTNDKKTPEEKEQILQKRKNTNKERYGAEFLLNIPEYRAQWYKTMTEAGIQPVATSRQQRYLTTLFNGVLNYPIGQYLVDCYIAEKNIIVEYSGGGHDLSVKLNKISPQDFLKKEQERRAYFYNLNIPVIEFVSKKDRLPTDEKILQYFKDSEQQFQKNNILYIQINLDTEKIIMF